MSKRTTISWSLMACVALLLSGACSTDEPREVPFPTFRAEEPIPGLGESAARGGEGGAEQGMSEYERKIQEAMGGKDKSGDDGEADSQKGVSRQAISLSGRFVADIPVKFDEWEWSTDGDVTLITHTPSGTSPDAIIYTERFSGIGARLPSLDTVLFQVTVDPTFSDHATLPQLLEIGVGNLVEAVGLPGDEIVAAMLGAASRTAGLGLNYQSDPSSFTGWRWIGHNTHETEVRLARTEGRLAEQASGVSEAGETIGALSEGLEGLERMKQWLAGLEGKSGEQKGAKASAWMLFGSVTIHTDSGVHLAVVCKKAPRCPVAEDIAHFLNSVRERSSGERAASVAQPSTPKVATLAERKGIPLAEQGVVPSVGSLLGEVRKLNKEAEAQESGGQTSGRKD